MTVYAWLFLLTMFQIIDGITTYIIVTGDIMLEANPLMAQFMEWFGIGNGIIILKSIVMIPGYYLIIKHWNKSKVRIASRIVTFIYFIIASLNTFCLLFYLGVT